MGVQNFATPCIGSLPTTMLLSSIIVKSNALISIGSVPTLNPSCHFTRTRKRRESRSVLPDSRTRMA